MIILYYYDIENNTIFDLWINSEPHESKHYNRKKIKKLVIKQLQRNKLYTVDHKNSIVILTTASRSCNFSNTSNIYS